MSWRLEIWWAHREGAGNPVDESFGTKAGGIARAAEVLADGLTISTPGSHLYYPAAAIRHVSLIEDVEE